MIQAFIAGSMLLAALLPIAERNAAPVGMPVEGMIQISGPAASPYGAQELHSVRITILQVLRGNSARQHILEANGSAQPPETGFEYLIARVRLEYDPDGAGGTLTYSIKPDDFRIYSEDDREYDRPPVEPLKPELIGLTFYPRDVREGWLCFKVAETDRKPLLFFYGGMWFQLDR
jgi:hypothetical protein